MNRKNTEQTAEPKKRNPKTIILTAVALLLVAALCTGGYFFWYKPQSQPDTSTVTRKPFTAEKTEITYETATYNGYTVPACFAEYLNQAEKDGAAAAKKYGTAAQIGNIRISVPEYAMYYSDFHKQMLMGYQTDESGTSPSASSMPADQTYNNSDITWEQRMAETSENYVVETFTQFYAALEGGLLLSDDYVTRFNESVTSYKAGAKNQVCTLDEYFEKYYVEGITAALAIRDIIMNYYCYEYQIQVAAQADRELTDAKRKAIYDADPYAYLYADVHIFTVNNALGIDETDYKAIHDLDSFLDYAGNYYAKAGQASAYTREVAEIDTLWQRVVRSTLQTKIGGEVADWVFSADRKDGDVGISTTNKGQCVVYLDKAPYDSNSIDIQQCHMYYNKSTQTTDPTEEEIKKLKETAATAVKRFEESDRSADSFESLTMVMGQDEYASSGGYINGLRRQNADVRSVSWLFDPARKTGDYKLIEVADGAVLYYFAENNTDDIDSASFIRTQYIKEAIDNALAALVQQEKTVKFYEKKKQESIPIANEIIRSYLGLEETTQE